MPDTRRDAILDQLRYLLDEVEMLRQVTARVPTPLLEARALEGSFSLKETLALLAALDAQVRLPRLEAAAGRVPNDTAIDEQALVGDAHTLSIDALVDACVAARQRLVATAERLPPEAWERGVTALLYAVTQEDADRLRTLTQQLFDAQGFGR